VKFHVKHSELALFSDAKAAEDPIQNLLGIDAAGEPAQRIRCQPEILGPELDLPGASFEECRQRLAAVLEISAMPFLCQSRMLRRSDTVTPPPP